MIETASDSRTPATGSILNLSQYDRAIELSHTEKAALADLILRQARGRRTGAWPAQAHCALDRLTRPLNGVLDRTAPTRTEVGCSLRRRIAEAMHENQISYWGWNEDQWLAAISRCNEDTRRHAVAASYLLSPYRHLHNEFPKIRRHSLVEQLLGGDIAAESVDRVRRQLGSWGYGSAKRHDQRLRNAMYEVMLECGSARLEDFSQERLAIAASRMHGRYVWWGFQLLMHSLRGLNIVTVLPVIANDADWIKRTAPARADVPKQWSEWAQKWYLTSSLSHAGRSGIYYDLIKAGRWLAVHHPDRTHPESWTRDLAAEWVATVGRMLVGEWSHAPSTVRYRQRLGLPLSARTREHHIGALRTFFRDCQEWEWIPRRFDPVRSLATPSSIKNTRAAVYRRRRSNSRSSGCGVSERLSESRVRDHLPSQPRFGESN